jgi:hypothetical protein
VRSHDTAEAWRADYAEWRSRIKGFWDVVRGYRTNVDQPFAVAESDIGHAGGVPDTALFGTPDMRRWFKMLVLVNERHIKFREDAFLFNTKKGSPPDPGARPPAQSAEGPSRGGVTGPGPPVAAFPCGSERIAADLHEVSRLEERSPNGAG